MTIETSYNARILVVDDQSVNTYLVERILGRAGYTNVRSANDPHQALEIFAEFDPQLLLLDLHMPRLDGYEVMQRIQPMVPNGLLQPILVLTADTSPETKRRALAAGATDFLTKPFDSVEVVLRIRNLLMMRTIQEQLHQQNRLLEERVQERTHDLQEARLETLQKLALAGEFRDDITGMHTQRVANLVTAIARALGEADSLVELLWRAAPLHDIGKIGVPDEILLHPGPLTEAQRARMRTHAEIGARILSGSRSRTLQLAAEIALTHHERWDGAGYPAGISGPDIPLSGRITAVADVFDALTNTRPYKSAWEVSDALSEIAAQAGTQFDPRVVSAFLHLPDFTMIERR